MLSPAEAYEAAGVQMDSYSLDNTLAQLHEYVANGGSQSYPVSGGVRPYPTLGQSSDEASVNASAEISNRSEPAGVAEPRPECILSFESLTESVASLNVVQQPVAAILAVNPSADVANVARQVVLSLASHDEAEVRPMSWSMDGRGRPPE